VCAGLTAKRASINVSCWYNSWAVIPFWAASAAILSTLVNTAGLSSFRCTHNSTTVPLNLLICTDYLSQSNFKPVYYTSFLYKCYSENHQWGTQRQKNTFVQETITVTLVHLLYDKKIKKTVSTSTIIRLYYITTQSQHHQTRKRQLTTNWSSTSLNAWSTEDFLSASLSTKNAVNTKYLICKECETHSATTVTSTTVNFSQ